MWTRYMERVSVLWRYKMAGWGLDHGVAGLGWTTTKHSLS